MKVVLIAFLGLFAVSTWAAEQPAQAYIIYPAAGEVVKSPVTVRFGLSGMGVAPAGVEKAGTGHHHLLINTDLPPLDKPIPADDNHRHFGAGQTEVVLDLPPGEYRIQLLMGGAMHVPHSSPVTSEVVEFSVQ